MKTSRKGWGLWSGFRALAVVSLLSIFSLHHAFAQQPTLLGDLDADAKPTVLDLQKLLNHISGKDEFHLVPNLIPYADLNEDGLINTNDVRLLTDAILGRGALPNPYAAPIVSAPEDGVGEEADVVGVDEAVLVQVGVGD